jgi:thiol-disulfide isomerase/thioredoxin
LRNGDVIPCQIKEINEKGIYFESTATKATFIPHGDVKAAELSTARDPTRLSPEKLKRLLMLPRMQRKFPPTHLIVSNAGDYLRGNVVSLGEADLTIEVRQETITVPRIGLSHIIWFHADELPSQERTKGDRAITPNETSTPPAELVSDSPADSEPAAGKPGLVQAICRNGVRMTFRPEQASLKALMGTSKLLDVCYLAIEDIDLLLLGKELDAYQEKGEYSGWRWNFAPDPQVLSESSEDDAGRQAGMESTLVGQLAPEFSLQTLDESWFKLSEHRGKILLLDFWASWCGPCVQSMPQIDTLMADYPAEEVLLVTVNLQESPAQIKALLERLKIAPQVVLDETGLVAEAYGAKAIPQTVLIDRDGVVARVFVGGGPKLPGQLKEAIDQLRAQAIKAP